MLSTILLITDLTWVLEGPTFLLGTCILKPSAVSFFPLRAGSSLGSIPRNQSAAVSLTDTRILWKKYYVRWLKNLYKEIIGSRKFGASVCAKLVGYFNFFSYFGSFTMTYMHMNYKRIFLFVGNFLRIGNKYLAITLWLNWFTNCTAGLKRYSADKKKNFMHHISHQLG